MARAIADIQVAFALFVALETWLTPFEGLDRRLAWAQARADNGSSPSVACWFAIAWIINAKAESLTMLYVGSALAGSAPARSMRPASATR